MKTVIHAPLRTAPALRGLVLAAGYSAVIAASLALALLLRFDFRVPGEFWDRFWTNLPFVIVLKLAVLAVFGQFRSLLSYFSLPDAKMLALAVGAASLVELAAWFAFSGIGILPRGVILADAIICFVGLCGLRVALRLYREQLLGGGHSPAAIRKKTAIVGTGHTAADLLRDVDRRPGSALEIVCLLSDDKAKIGSTLHGKPILGPVANLPLIAKTLGLQKVVLATPDAKPAFIRTLVKELNALGLDHDVVPSFAQLVHRRVTVNTLRHIEPSDLLGREQVRLDEVGISRMIQGEVVLVTGAGGSIGSELCRQLGHLAPSKLVLVDRSEPALFSVQQELQKLGIPAEIIPRAYDVCDADQMERLFDAHRPAFVFQAAAHKHVPLMEEQPEEALRNNVLGTAVVAGLAAKHGTSKFVLVSTDKAADPCSVMGASKRLAEMVLEDHHASGAPPCAFCAVRFGNVLGSSGSVVPIFRRQISEGGPVTVTDREATRFFMSLTEAVGLILQSALLCRGGEIFVLDMGNAIKIDDLARQMIELSGFVPDEDIKVVYTGLRRGERLHEVPVHLSKDVGDTAHSQIRCLRGRPDGAGRELIATLLAQSRLLSLDENRLRAFLLASAKTRASH